MSAAAPPVADGLAIALLLALPLAIAAWHARSMTVDTFVFNANGNSIVRMVGSLVAANVGIGTFVALHAFATGSALVGGAIALAFVAGLFGCALLAGRIRAAAEATGTRGLVEVIAVTHGIRHVSLVWIPVTSVFLLRVVVQIIALAAVLGSAFGIGAAPALLLATTLAAAQVTLGGYRAATLTDVLQASVILAVIAIAFAAVPLPEGSGAELLRLGPYEPVLLVAIAFLLPFSVPLSIDNWMRLTTAPSTRKAAAAFSIAAVLCAFVYGTIILASLAAPGGDITAAFRALMPAGLAPLVDLMLVAAIMSSIDTLVMPMTTALARGGLGLPRLRLAVLAIVAVAGGVAAVLGSIVEGVIAAFSSLVVFLPVVAGALVLRRAFAWAAVPSLWSGWATALLLVPLSTDAAGVGGFLVAAAVYVAAHLALRHRSGGRGVPAPREPDRAGAPHPNG